MKHLLVVRLTLLGALPFSVSSIASGATTTNYRSIGTDSSVLYSTGNASIMTGQTLVTFGGGASLPLNVGVGDKLDIGGEILFILSRDSPTEVTVQTAATSNHFNQSYGIRRAYTSLATWESGRQADLVAQNRSEVGVAYNDGPLAGVDINGWTTNATHTITLTVARGQRHNGRAASGVVLNNGSSTNPAITIQEEFVTIEWLEIMGGGSTADGIEFTSISGSNKGVVRNCLIHDILDGDGIRVTNEDADADIYNNIIYNVDRGIRVGAFPVVAARILNNTVYRCHDVAGNLGLPTGISVAGGNANVILRNNIAHSNYMNHDPAQLGDFDVGVLDASSSHNLSRDNTAPGSSPLIGVSLPDVNFENPAPGSENLHIKSGSFAAGNGTNLSSIFRYDIDWGLRPLSGAWDRGADELAATTAVELLSFEGRAGDGAAELIWETTAEIENLGFYLYRGTSERGPFERITSTLIPGLGSSPSGARYRCVDSGLENGNTYYYILEDVETSGARAKHGPVSVTPRGGASPPTPTSAGSPSSSGSIVYGKPEEVSVRVVASDRSGVTLELLTGGFYAEAQSDGTVRLTVPGFVDEQGAIPSKRVWLDAVVGRKVRMTSVVARDVVEFSSLRPSGALIPEVVTTRGVVQAGVRRASVSNRNYSKEWARLLSVVFQGEMKKALVELTPLGWDGTRLFLARRLTVRVVFAGRELGETSGALSPSAARARASRGASVGVGPHELIHDASQGRRHREPKSHRRGASTVPTLLVSRLRVKERGLYGVRFEDVLAVLGRSIPATQLQLSRQGKQVAYHLVGRAGAQRFGPGSVLYFVSEGASLNPYGEAAVYELSVGEEGLRMPVVDGRPRGTPREWYWQRVEREENLIYHPALLEAEEPWLWDTLLSPVMKSYAFEASRLASVEAARLSLWLQGASDFAGSPDHHVRVYVNGSLVGEESWEGKTPLKLEAEMGPGVLVEGENQVAIENVGDKEVSSMVMLEGFSVVYPRVAVAEGATAEGRWSESGAAEVQGLGGRAFVVDTTEEPTRWLTGALPVEGGLRFRAEKERRYLAVGEEAVLQAEVVRPTSSALKSERNTAEYLVVGPSELLVEAAPLVRLRRSQGLMGKAVPIEEVYSEFGYGEERPEAIRDFLAYAYHHWSRPSPRYVLLLGDATYDFKDYLGKGVRNQVPPYLIKTSYWWTASDPTYAAVNGEDVLPDLSIGRLPAKTREEARALVEKIIAYETGGASLQGRAVLVVDNSDRAGDFEADAEEIATGVLADREVETIRVRELGRAGTRAAIREAFDRGSSLMSYVGHGSILVWASENVLNIGDVKHLSSQEQQPFLLTMNCLNGFFHFPHLNSLSEELLKAEGRGVIGAFSPTGLSVHGPAHHYHKALLSELVSGRWERVGDAVLEAQATFAERGEFLELVSIYHLLGDPALRLR